MDRVVALCISDQVHQLQETMASYTSGSSSTCKIDAHVIDLTDWNATSKLVDSIEHSIHMAVNNAGCVKLSPVGQVSEEDFDLHLNLNVKAVANVTQCVARNMKRHGIAGSIVNISSQASHTALEGHFAYCASKAAVDGLTRVAALELASAGIRVNSIQPTVTMTPLAREAWKDAAKAERLLSRIPLGRFLEPSEVANVVTWLLSREASMINGTSIPVDGGFSIA